MHNYIIKEFSRPVVKKNHEIVHIFVFFVMIVVVVIALTQIFIMTHGVHRDQIILTQDEEMTVDQKLPPPRQLDIEAPLVVHRKKFDVRRQPPVTKQEYDAAQQVKQELLALEQTIDDLKLKNIPEIEKYRTILKNDIYAERISGLIKRTSDVDYSEFTIPDSNLDPNVFESISQSIWNNSVIDSKADLHPFRNKTLNRTSLESYRFNVTTAEFVYVNSTRNILDLCPILPEKLFGAVFVNANHSDNMTKAAVYEQNADISLGGSWTPSHCISRHRVAIIIPYRDRERHLIILLSHLLPILRRQELQFKIFVVEQEGKDTFNKARIMNAAFREAIQQYDFQCVVFHDVDLLPEDDRNMYSCPQQPRHMSVAIDEMGYKVPYEYLVGGVLSMRTDHYQLVNGYSNLYWGWGAEDDDMAFRIMHVGLKITRPPSKVARYKMIRHEKRKPTDWRKRRQLLRSGTRRFNFDGLNSVTYTLISITEYPLYTHILVNIGKPPAVS